MQTVSAGFTAAAASTTQQLAYYLEVAWGGVGTVNVTDARGAVGWTNESAYLLSHSGEIRLNVPGEKLVAAGDIGRLTVVLNNTTQRFSWLNAGAALHASIGGVLGVHGKPVRLWQGFVVSGSPEYVCIFTGVFNVWGENSAQGTVILTARDWGFVYLQDRRSSLLYTNRLPGEWTDVVATLAGVSTWQLDAGIYRIPWAWLDDESVVEEIWQTWEADGGLAYFDQSGRLRGEDILHWLSHTSVWTLDEGDYQLADPSFSADAVASQITVEWAGRTIGAATVLYTLDAVKTIMPGQTETWTARYQQACAALLPVAATAPDNDYAAQSYGGVELTSQLTVTLSAPYAQQCTVSVTNNSATAAARLTKLQLRGFPLLGGPTEQATANVPASALPYTRVRSVRGNAYLQSGVQGNGLAAGLAARANRVRPVWKLSGLLGIPQLELGDLVTFKDNRALGSGQSLNALVLGITWEGGPAVGFTQGLTLWDCTGLAVYSDYFIIGATALGTAGRAYY